MKSLFSLLLLLCPFLSLRGQDAAAGQLFARFKAAAGFDHRYPREKVYLHLDSNAYVEGDTLWLKAYVVRASSLQPTTLSGVLYVELLNADGDLMERKQFQVQDGQAHGDFKLDLPVRAGFYEVRAYTREMLNWGAAACFSRVVPVFEKKALADDAPLEIDRPQAEDDLSAGHPRPYDFETAGQPCQLAFYPEGGDRVAGLAGRIAFRLTDSAGRPLTDSLRVFDSAGRQVLVAAPEHDGMGIFTLPADVEGGCAKVGEGSNELQFPLPEARKEGYVLTATEADGGTSVVVQRSPGLAPELLGLAVHCREQMCYFDTLTVDAGAVELFLPAEALRGGVNRIELFDASGHSLCCRLVFKPVSGSTLRAEVRQNKAIYEPFSPVAIDISVTDGEGRPVPGVPLSLSVRDSVGELVRAPQTDMAIDLLLSSELRGWIANPAFYFERDDARHRHALDLLLLVQGWTANAFDVMSGREHFDLREPIEERLTLNGRVMKDRGTVATQARAGATLHLQMFSRSGGAMEADALTDSLGRFAFVAAQPYTGDWVGQFSTRVDGKLKWSRVLLDRWFAPSPRSFAWAEMELEAPVAPASGTSVASRPSLFEWTDTLPPARNVMLGAAEVVHRNRYRGLIGNRYSYKGGEKAGIRRAQAYYNVSLETERMKDGGQSVGLIWDWLAQRDDRFTYEAGVNMGDARTRRFFTAMGDTSSIEPAGETYAFYYRGRPALVFLDNELFMQFRKGDDPVIYADELKSVVVMQNPSDWRRFLPSGMLGSEGELEAMSPAALFLYTRPNMFYMKTKKGVEKRVISGFAEPTRFYSPNYRGVDLPSRSDLRRTLYWNPSLRTDAQGRASAVFFSNAREGQQLRVSLRGLSPDGRIVTFGD